MMSTHENNSPDVSVIMPTYNVEKFIMKALESLICQEYKNFEVICVDDGSSDSTVSIIKEAMEKDNRISLIEMPHCGKAGVMRNHGLQQAKGEYCLFLDGDDFFEKNLIGHTLQKAREDQADICIFNARIYDEKAKLYKSANYMLKKEYFPESIPYEGRTFPYVMNISTGCPWTKLYRRSFIEENGLEFMALQRSNDLYFVITAMAMAKRITILNEVLVNYRQSGESLQSNNASTPWDWYHALQAIKDKLVEVDLYQDVELSFKNFVIGNAFYNLNSIKQAEPFGEIFDHIKNKMLSEFDLLEFKEEECYTYNKEKYKLYTLLKTATVQEYLFYMLNTVKDEKIYWVHRAKKAEENLKKAEKDLKNIKEESKLSYKLKRGIKKVLKR